MSANNDGRNCNWYIKWRTWDVTWVVGFNGFPALPEDLFCEGLMKTA